jgi:hypothetical protein
MRIGAREAMARSSGRQDRPAAHDVWRRHAEHTARIEVHERIRRSDDEHAPAVRGDLRDFFGDPVDGFTAPRERLQIVEDDERRETEVRDR